MANLMLKFDDALAYSDGTLLPSEEAESINNKLISKSVNCYGEEFLSIAATDVDGGDSFVFPDPDNNLSEVQDLHSSYIVVSDSDWVTVIRERNITRFIVPRNIDPYERIAHITFKHNTEKEVYCVVEIFQAGEEYTLTVDRNTVQFSTVSESTETVNVTCTGGSGEYVVHKIRKYTIINPEDNPINQIKSRVVFDNGITVTGYDDHIGIKSVGSLILDSSYYEVILEHKDLIGLTASIIVKMPPYDPIQMPTHNPESGETCPPAQMLAEKDIPIQSGHINPSVSADMNEITIDSSGYSDEITVVTSPEESQIYFTYYGTFIDDYIITDYEERDGSITHGLKIKAKPNPFGIGRNCIGYIINAMYPQVRYRINIHQDGNT